MRQKNVYTNFHSCIIRDIWELETIQMSLNSKTDVEYSHNGIIYSNKNEQITATHNINRKNPYCIIPFM